MESSLSSAQRTLLRTGVSQMGLDLPDAALSKIEQHLALVYKWRAKINLISIANESDLVTRHALDSLVIAPLLENSKDILDIGSGAGFPGLQLACICPSINITLLDSRRRRVEFLRLVSATLALENVALSSDRIECHQPSVDIRKLGEARQYDTIVARAVASLSQLISLTRHLHASGQRLIAMKGVYPLEEIKEIEQQSTIPIRDLTVERLEVPFLSAQRHAVIIHF